jgi:hypothetical protein
VHRVCRYLLATACLYQAAFGTYVGVSEKIPLLVQAGLSLCFIRGWLVAWATCLVAAVVCLANLAPWLDIPTYPWLTYSHPLVNAAVFAVAGVCWLTRSPRSASPENEAP